jgi:hypothetical protein
MPVGSCQPPYKFESCLVQEAFFKRLKRCSFLFFSSISFEMLFHFSVPGPSLPPFYCRMCLVFNSIWLTLSSPRSCLHIPACIASLFPKWQVRTSSLDQHRRSQFPPGPLHTLPDRIAAKVRIVKGLRLAITKTTLRKAPRHVTIGMDGTTTITHDPVELHGAYTDTLSLSNCNWPRKSHTGGYIADELTKIIECIGRGKGMRGDEAPNTPC